MLIPAVGSVQALISSATCLSCRANDVLGYTVVNVGVTLLSDTSVCIELVRVSLAALINLNSLSSGPSSVNEASREFFSAVLAPGASFNCNTAASGVFESATASWRVSVPVSNRLMPAIETLLGNVTSPFNPRVLSASLPPQPV